MNDEKALLLNIAVDRDDDLSRLAYADLMEERGNLPRAEFIRLQCELARDERDRHLTSLERAEMKEREAELLEKHKAEWAGEAAKLDPVFRRGFVERVTVDMHYATHYKKAFQRLRQALPTITGLKITTPSMLSIQASRISEILTHEVCKGLRELNLDSLNIGDDGARAVATSGLALERLSLRSCSIDIEGVRALAQSEHLQRLRVLELENSADIQSVGGILSRPGVFPCLEELNLANTRIDINDVQAIAFSLARQGLKRLNLSDNMDIRNECVAQLADPGCMFKLRELNLRHTLVGDEGATLLAQSERFSNLEALRLDRTPIYLQGAQALAESPHLGKLETLGMSRTYIESEGVALLIDGGLRGLRNLDVSSLRDHFGDVGDVEMETALIASCKGLERLHRLNLGENAIDGENLEELLASPHLGNLRELELRANPIGRRGAQALAEADNLTSLRKLGLDDCDIGEQGMITLANSTRLEALDKINLENNYALTTRLQFKGPVESAIVGAVGTARLADRVKLYHGESADVGRGW